MHDGLIPQRHACSCWTGTSCRAFGTQEHADKPCLSSKAKKHDPRDSYDSTATCCWHAERREPLATGPRAQPSSRQCRRRRDWRRSKTPGSPSCATLLQVGFEPRPLAAVSRSHDHRSVAPRGRISEMTPPALAFCKKADRPNRCSVAVAVHFCCCSSPRPTLSGRQLRLHRDCAGRRP